MKEPIITIVTACWRWEGVKQIVEDVDNQTFKGWQHILVNDNSPHINISDFKSLCDGKKRHWVDLQTRHGWSGGPARNIGISASFSYFRQSHKQDWNNYFITFFDDDNRFSPDHLQLMVDAIKKNPTATIVGASMNFVTSNGSRVKKLVIAPEKCDLGSFIYRRDLFFKYGFWNPRPECRFRFDYDLIKRMADGEKDNLIILDEPTWSFTARK
jgi:GT2 family glycosyltransferase